MTLVLRSFFLIFFVAAFTALVACAPQARSIKTEVKAAVDTEKEAKTLSEYESSENHPDVLFAKWNAENGTDPEITMNVETEGETVKPDTKVDTKPKAKAQPKVSSQLCEELSQLPPHKLIVFEEQVEAYENRKLLAPCLTQLKGTIEAFYQEERKNLKHPVNPYAAEPSGNSFRFPENIQTRDISHGYTAVRGDLARKEVVLTFDDGPHPKYTPSILRSLHEVSAKAIFFEMGKNVKNYPEMTKLVAAGGHGLGAHSMTHGCLAQNAMCDGHNYHAHLNGGHALSEEQALAEIKGSLQAIYDLLGWVDPYFRFPYGEVSANLASILKQNGIANFLWSIDSNDWKAQSAQELIRNTFQQLDKEGRGIILFHDVHRKTAEAMPEFLSQLYAKGYSVVLLQPRDGKIVSGNGMVKARRSQVGLGAKP